MGRKRPPVGDRGFARYCKHGSYSVGHTAVCVEHGALKGTRWNHYKREHR